MMDDSVFLVENERGVHAVFTSLDELTRFANSEEGKMMKDLAVVQFQANSTAWANKGRLWRYVKNEDEF